MESWTCRASAARISVPALSIETRPVSPGRRLTLRAPPKLTCSRRRSRGTASRCSAPTRVPRMATGTTVAPEFSASQATPLLMADGFAAPPCSFGQDPDAPSGVEDPLGFLQRHPVTRTVDGELARGSEYPAEEAVEQLLLDQDVHGPGCGAEHDGSVQETDVVPGEDHRPRGRHVGPPVTRRSGRRRGPAASPRAGSRMSSTAPAVPAAAQSRLVTLWLMTRSTMPSAASTVCGEVQVRGVQGHHAVGGLREVHHGGVLGVALGHLRGELLGVLAAAKLDAPAAQARLLAGGEQHPDFGAGARRRW